jgi:serine/threonine protein kinase
MDSGTLLAGRYRLHDTIGVGEMGRVWTAVDTVLDRAVAIKTVELAIGHDTTTLQRFEREARAAAGLQHPNVVTIFDSGTDAATAFLVMELLPGPNLADYLAQRGLLPEAETIWLAQQAASGLAAAHAGHVIHRDIKPANLMFNANGVLKILDFGVARLAQTAASQLTATNTVIGSAPYLSPEQIDGRQADERSDIYALGCVLTTMLTGRPPFDAEHPMALLHQHTTVEPPRISARRPDTHPDLDKLVAEMLSKSPDDRPATALSVLHRLQAVNLADAPQHPATPGQDAPTEVLHHPTRPLPLGGIPHTPDESMPPGTPETDQSKTRQGRRTLLTTLFALAVAAVVAVALAVAGDDPTLKGNVDPGPTTTAPAPATTTSPPRSSDAATSTTTQPSSQPASPATYGQAIAQLRATVTTVSNTGEADRKKAKELEKRVDELAKHATKKEGKDLDKKLEEFEKYLQELAEKGELSQAGLRRIQTALNTVKNLAPAEG